MDSLEIPLAVSAAFFALFAAFEWRRLPLWARVHLGVATAFALAAVSHPGMSVAELVDSSHDGMAYLVAAARMAGLTAALVSVATFLRELALR